MSDKRSPWLIVYQSLLRSDAETDLIVTRSKAMELEVDYIIQRFMEGRLSATEAEEMIQYVKMLHEQAPEVFDLH